VRRPLAPTDLAWPVSPYDRASTAVGERLRLTAADSSLADSSSAISLLAVSSHAASKRIESTAAASMAATGDEVAMKWR
jgi:hypothetical protein